MSISTEQISALIEEMAVAGYNREVEGNDWHKDLNKNSIQREMWREIAREMLLAVKFPAGLYQTCFYLHNRGKGVGE